MNLNQNEIERILRQPPQPRPPAGLNQRLIAQINLRAASAASPVLSLGGGFTAWLRRWWPALAPATISLACATLMVAQQVQVRALRDSNQTLARQLAEESAAV